MIKGIGASSGIAFGKVLVIKNENLNIEKKSNINID